jgi:hypothetical protein
LGKKNGAGSRLGTVAKPSTPMRSNIIFGNARAALYGEPEIH